MAARKVYFKIIQNIACFAYLCGILILAYFACCQGLSNYYAERAEVSGAPEDISKAVKADPSNPEAYKAGGLLLLRSQDFTGAAEMFKEAIARRENDYHLWLRLGYINYKTGDLISARLDFLRALALSPNSAQANYYLGHLELKGGGVEESFRYLRKAAEIDDDLFAKVLRLARRQYPTDGEAIEKAVSPSTPAARKKLAIYLIKHSLATLSTREFLLGENLGDEEKNEFIQFLVKKNDFRLARQIWATQKNNRLLIINNANEILTDGSFESTTESDEAGFGWRVNRKLIDASAAIDEAQSHSGKKSIYLSLFGKTNLNVDILSQTAIVEPVSSYTLDFYASASEILSYGGIKVVVFDAADRKILGQSPLIKNSLEKWERYQINFHSNETRAVVIAVQRSDCKVSPCPLFADLRFDDFYLRKAEK